MVFLSNKEERQAVKFIKTHKKELIERFASLESYTPSEKPFTFLMAGGSGAGKTEYADSMIEGIKEIDENVTILRIDADEVKTYLQEMYPGADKLVLHKAAALGVDKLFDYVQEHNQNCIVDGTFADFGISKRNVERALGRGRKVGITYVYIDPFVAWEYVQIRKLKEKRSVPRDVFIESFFKSFENVEAVKREFGSKVEVDVVVFDKNNRAKNNFYNVERVDSYVKLGYNKEELYDKLPEETNFQEEV